MLHVRRRLPEAETSKTGRSGIYDVVVSDENDQTIALFRGLSRTIKGQQFPENITANGDI